MTVTNSTSARDAATNAVLNLLGAGSLLKFRLAGTIGAPGAAVATLTFTTPNAFGASSAGTATAATITQDSSAVGNASPVANASFETSGGTLIVHCSVAASASDINMSGGLVIAAADIVQCSQLTYQALAA
jgi:proline racemase